mgnify:CR=1 FL=1
MKIGTDPEDIWVFGSTERGLVCQIHSFKGKTEENVPQIPNFSPAARYNYYVLLSIGGS